jgi:hypothetical protein
MDGIGLELWNKKLLQCRYKRQLEFRACAELAHAGRAYTSEPLASVLFQAGADNLDLLVLYWKETFQGSWQRQNPQDPDPAAGQARGEIETILTTEQKQIENEVKALGESRVLHWKPEELEPGKAHLNSRVSLLRASCIAQIADVRQARTQELELLSAGRLEHRRELWITRAVMGLFVLASSLGGVWLGATLNAKRSREDRLFVDQRMSRLMEGQRKAQEQLSVLHSSNRKIAFWTEKTPEQIDRDAQDTRERLKAEIQDIHAETLRKIGLVESEYARAGRNGGTELEDRRQSLLRLEEKLAREAQQRAQKKIDDLEDQKRNIQH